MMIISRLQDVLGYENRQSGIFEKRGFSSQRQRQVLHSKATWLQLQPLLVNAQFGWELMQSAPWWRLGLIWGCFLSCRWRKGRRQHNDVLQSASLFRRWVEWSSNSFALVSSTYHLDELVLPFTSHICIEKKGESVRQFKMQRKIERKIPYFTVQRMFSRGFWRLYGWETRACSAWKWLCQEKMAFLTITLISTL